MPSKFQSVKIVENKLIFWVNSDQFQGWKMESSQEESAKNKSCNSGRLQVFTLGISNATNNILYICLSAHNQPSSGAMSTPLQYYNSIPPVAKTYAVACLFTTGAHHLGLYNVWNIALFYSDVFKRFQVWRLITPVFFLGPFSLPFAMRFLTILLYGVQLERGPFDKRTADLVWMYMFGAMTLVAIAAIPYFWSPFTGPSFVFVLAYIWAREFPNARINVHGLFELKGFYLPWYMAAVEMLLGNPVKQALVGIAAAHLYYFLSVIHPLSTGTNAFKTPKWVHKLVAFWGEGFQRNSPYRYRSKDSSSGFVFRGRSNRLNGTRTTAPPPEPPHSAAAGDGAFSGRSRRLGTR